MEIIPFLRLSGRRVVALWLVGATAGVAGAAYARSLPVTYTGETTVFLDRVYPGARYEREPFVATYRSAVEFLTNTHVRVGEQVGLTGEEVGDGLDVEVPEGSDLAYVRFDSANREVAESGAQLLANETLLTLTQDGLAAAQASLDRAVTAEAEAQKALSAITEPFGVVDLQREYEGVDNQVKDLEKQLASLGQDTSSQGNLNNLLTFRKEQRSALAAALPGYQSAKSRLDKLRGTTENATTGLENAEARVAVAQNGEAVVALGSRPESQAQKMLRFGGAAAIGAVALVLLVFVVLEAMDRPSRPAAQTQVPAAGGMPWMQAGGNVAGRGAMPGPGGGGPGAGGGGPGGPGAPGGPGGPNDPVGTARPGSGRV